MTIFQRVMKAPNEIIPFDDPRIRYPMYESRKFDGFRCLMFGNWLLTSSLKEFPNICLRERFADAMSICAKNDLMLDGELWSPEIPFEKLGGILRANNRLVPPSIELYAFDAIRISYWLNNPLPYTSRLSLLRDVTAPGIVFVSQKLVETPNLAQACFEKRIEDGQEGSILRSITAGYKHGRCTHNESAMFKFKQFETVDARIIGVIRRKRMRDGLERGYDIQGLLKRSHRQEDYVDDDAIAGFNVRLADGTECGVTAGKGFNDGDKRMWFMNHTANPQYFIGKCVEFKHMPHGAKDKPRIGSLVRFREDKV